MPREQCGLHLQILVTTARSGRGLHALSRAVRKAVEKEGAGMWGCFMSDTKSQLKIIHKRVFSVGGESFKAFMVLVSNITFKWVISSKWICFAFAKEVQTSY